MSGYVRFRLTNELVICNTLRCAFMEKLRISLDDAENICKSLEQLFLNALHSAESSPEKIRKMFNIIL